MDLVRVTLLMKDRGGIWSKNLHWLTMICQSVKSEPRSFLYHVMKLLYLIDLQMGQKIYPRELGKLNKIVLAQCPGQVGSTCLTHGSDCHLLVPGFSIISTLLHLNKNPLEAVPDLAIGGIKYLACAGLDMWLEHWCDSDDDVDKHRCSLPCLFHLIWKQLGLFVQILDGIILNLHPFSLVYRYLIRMQWWEGELRTSMAGLKSWLPFPSSCIVLETLPK